MIHVDINDPNFWDSQTDYRAMAHGFTSRYARDAWKAAELPDGVRVLDIAAGAGALALVAQEAGAEVFATDFSPGMVTALRSYGLPRLDAEMMNGQALALPDASFDAAFSMFGVTLFPDWRAGLTEMARVVRSGGTGCIGTWAEAGGAASNLLLDRLVAVLFPEMERPLGPDGMYLLRTPDRLGTAMTEVGFTDVAVNVVTHEYLVDSAALMNADRLFQFSPIWPMLTGTRGKAVMETLKVTLEARDDALPVPSPALIAVGRKV